MDRLVPESGERFEVTLLPAEGQAKCNPANPFETEIESSGSAANTFRILSVEGAGEGVTVVNALPDAPAETHRLTFQVQKAEAGDFKRKLQIKTDLQSAPVAVTVEGSVSP